MINFLTRATLLALAKSIYYIVWIDHVHLATPRLTLTLGPRDHVRFDLDLETTWPRPLGKGIIMLFWDPLNDIFMVFSGGDSTTTPRKGLKEMAPYNIMQMNCRIGHLH